MEAIRLGPATRSQTRALESLEGLEEWARDQERKARETRTGQVVYRKNLPNGGVFIGTVVTPKKEQNRPPKRSYSETISPSRKKVVGFAVSPDTAAAKGRVYRVKRDALGSYTGQTGRDVVERMREHTLILRSRRNTHMANAVRLEGILPVTSIKKEMEGGERIYTESKEIERWKEREGKKNLNHQIYPQTDADRAAAKAYAMSIGDTAWVQRMEASRRR